ncbi:MAG: DUF4281 domain-containing protein [Myxococcales bacterium]|nr:DUF4281 domain-containing protein [Myxococcales bacterium]
MSIAYIALNAFAVVGWSFLFVAPRARITAYLVRSVAFPLLFAAIYLLLAAISFGRAGGSLLTLDGLAAAFQDRGVLLAGWVHYITLDLFVGCWELTDSQRCGIRHRALLPCLILTLMVAPVGLLAYLALRRVKTGGHRLFELTSPTSASHRR